MNALFNTRTRRRRDLSPIKLHSRVLEFSFTSFQALEEISIPTAQSILPNITKMPTASEDVVDTAQLSTAPHFAQNHCPANCHSQAPPQEGAKGITLWLTPSRNGFRRLRHVIGNDPPDRVIDRGHITRPLLGLSLEGIGLPNLSRQTTSPAPDLWHC